MISMTTIKQSKTLQDGIRPINLKTDLAPLADLIELVFKDTMDDSGRAAIQEMRYRSKFTGFNILGRLNDLALGLNEGYVAIVDGKLVGNVSIYPANWSADAGKAWLIANVGTHPNYRQRGIARQLMEVCMKLIAQKGATYAILQVDYDNHKAIDLYEGMGFVRERAFTKWIRSGLVSAPANHRAFQDIFITQPRRSEWAQEYQLAQATRPNERGGIAWLKPLSIKDFRPSFWRSIRQLFAVGQTEKLIIRDEAEEQLLASLWVERSFALTRTRLTLFSQPNIHRRYTEALLTNALRRYSNSGFTIEHPHDDLVTTELLNTYRFRPHRTVWHMRYEY